jgi:hypothetical protein
MKALKNDENAGGRASKKSEVVAVTIRFVDTFRYRAFPLTATERTPTHLPVESANMEHEFQEHIIFQARGHCQIE